MTKAQLLEKIISTLPPPTITNIDLETTDALRFDWHGDRYRVALDGHVELVDGHLLSSDPKATLMAKLLK